jgi:LemA protein
VTAVIIIVVIVVLLALFLVVSYNGMVRGRNKVDESWSGIDVQLKRRHDLIPNLVETVKGYATHEREVFQAVTDARTRAMSASTPAAAGAAEGILGQAIGRLFAVAEAYPDLKASQNFLELQGTLNQLESEIAAARRIYNSNVQSYNTRIQSFPGVTLAGPFGFQKREFFELDNPADREPVAVSFSDPPAAAPTAAPAAPVAAPPAADPAPAAPAAPAAPDAPADPPATS